MSRYNFSIKGWKDLVPLVVIILIPFVLILLQKETGSALVFIAFFLVLYREGMKGQLLLLGVLAVVLFIIEIRFSELIIGENQGNWGLVAALIVVQSIQLFFPLFSKKTKSEGLIVLGVTVVVIVASLVINKWYALNFNYIAGSCVVLTAIFWAVNGIIQRHPNLIYIGMIGIGSMAFIYISDTIFNDVLERHQQVRIKVLLNMEDDPTGAGYNVNQSKIAIGSGGLTGKGFLNGTQTKLKYVPEQDTDFIFCTVGEEHGFIGSVTVLILYWLLLMRLLKIAERQREIFHRVYAYSVVSILFFHLMINVGMVLGVMPVIGIPLPFFSYGGSSLWGFTILLFILLRLDASRLER